MKRWTATLLLAVVTLAAVAGVGLGASAQSTANVEVRVWQSVSDARSLYISARPEGSSWATLGTISLPLDDGLSASGRFRYGDITVSVPVAGYEASVEVRVWQDVGDARSIYISARDWAGGSWATLGTIPLPLDDGLSASGRFRYGDITLAVSLYPPELTEPPETTPQPTATPTPTPAPQRAEDCRFEDSAAKVIASTVKVTTSSSISGSAFYVGNSQFVTAGHVVEDGPSWITLRNERVSVSARLVGYYAFRNGDVAILEASGAGLTPLDWAGTLAPGASIGIVGYPEGLGVGASISRGIVSRLFTQGGVSYIQTDAAVSPGNSGGPLVDACGRVAGVVSSSYVGDRGSEGLHFAVAEPTLSQRLTSIRSGTAPTPTPTPRGTTPAEPTWAQIDDFIEQVMAGWSDTIDEITVLIDQWNSIIDYEYLPSERLASVAREERALAQGMVDWLTRLRSDPALTNTTVARWWRTAIAYWERDEELRTELQRYALAQVPWETVERALAARLDAFDEFASHHREVIALLYPD